MNLNGRALHYVLKVGDRGNTINFYKGILGMKILRHEEFTEGCEAKCNGPYDNRWSKTMVGYGCEDTHFVVELTYNYNISSYDLGNDFLGLTIRSSTAISNAKKCNWGLEYKAGYFIIRDPLGYPISLIDDPQPMDRDPIEKVTLASTNLCNTIEYWNGTLGVNLCRVSDHTAAFAFDGGQTQLEFQEIGYPIDHSTAYGRIAYSVPCKELLCIEKRMKETEEKILTPLVTLDTPGKTTVTVVILADPDNHEICFVDDEGFRELSQFDPDADCMLSKFIQKDEERKGNV